MSLGDTLLHKPYRKSLLVPNLLRLRKSRSVITNNTLDVAKESGGGRGSRAKFENGGVIRAGESS